MSELSLVKILYKNLPEFKQFDADNARNIKRTLQKCPKQLDNKDLIDWWKEQDIHLISSLRSYAFWLWTSKEEIESSLFENIYDTLIPITSKSWSMPVEVTNGLDSPMIEGGFFSREFSIFQYKFSPVNYGFSITCQEYPPASRSVKNLDLFLSFLSFLLGKYNFGDLGFRQIHARKWVSNENSLITSSFGPEIRQDMIDLDFVQLEDMLRYVESEEKEWSGLSLTELFRVRHRAILDSSLESKLVTLWSAFEAMWGKDENSTLLLTSEEIDNVKEVIGFLPKTKFDKVVEKINELKTKTKNDRIIEEVGKFDYAKNIENLGKEIRDIFSMRGKLVHGKFLNEKDVVKINRYVNFMMAIFNELILKRLAEININLAL